jgi:hypothetical protein
MSDEKVDSKDARADYSGNVEEEESTVNRSDVAGNPIEASLTGHESTVGRNGKGVVRIPPGMKKVRPRCILRREVCL